MSPKDNTSPIPKSTAGPGSKIRMRSPPQLPTTQTMQSSRQPRNSFRRRNSQGGRSIALSDTQSAQSHLFHSMYPEDDDLSRFAFSLQCDSLMSQPSRRSNDCQDEVPRLPGTGKNQIVDVDEFRRAPALTKASWDSQSLFTMDDDTIYTTFSKAQMFAIEGDIPQEEDEETAGGGCVPFHQGMDKDELMSMVSALTMDTLNKYGAPPAAFHRDIAMTNDDSSVVSPPWSPKTPTNTNEQLGESFATLKMGNTSQEFTEADCTINNQKTAYQPKPHESNSALPTLPELPEFQSKSPKKNKPWYRWFLILPCGTRSHPATDSLTDDEDSKNIISGMMEPTEPTLSPTNSTASVVNSVASVGNSASSVGGISC